MSGSDVDILHVCTRPGQTAPACKSNMSLIRYIDNRLQLIARDALVSLSVAGVLFIGWADYASGYEISMSLLYLAPVTVAAWYGGRRIGLAIAILSCCTWYGAELAAGRQYSHAAIPVWNALVRLGFFAITARLIDALHTSLRREQALARSDGLTGLYSRRAFEERLRHDLDLARHRQSALTLAYLDLDDFKVINDRHGHAEGDRVLRAVGRVLSSFMRDADTAGRLGGDEFALVFPDTDAGQARAAISNLRARLHAELAREGRSVHCSMGAVTFLSPADSPESALAAADELMYRVKREGKGVVRFSVIGDAKPSHTETRLPTAPDH